MGQVEEIKSKRTKSFHFVLPMLGGTIDDYIDDETRGLRSSGLGVDIPLLNCYVGDSSKPEYNNHIFLLYKFIGTKVFGLFLEKLSEHPLYTDLYGVSPKHDILVFNVPEQYELEYKLFKSEKPKIYRRFSDNYKKQVIKFLDPLVNIESIESILYHKESRFKEQEKLIGQAIPRDLDNYSIPIIEEETFNKKKLNKL